MMKTQYHHPSKNKPIIVLFNKPYQVLCQFSPLDRKTTLKNFIDHPDLYPAGRLDYDSEGLVVLTNHGGWQHRLTHPNHKLGKTYWVQVDGQPKTATLQQLRHGIHLKDGPTLPATVKAIAPPKGIWPRIPPIRSRLTIPTSWLEITLQEGRNRQVRRMTAQVGHPTLRLIRIRVGPYHLTSLAPGQWHEANSSQLFC